MVGVITNEAALKPQITGPGGLMSRGGKELGISPEYREVLRKRKLEASKPRHSVKVLDDGDTSRNNMLTSGVGSGFDKASKASLIVSPNVVPASSLGLSNIYLTPPFIFPMFQITFFPPGQKSQNQ